MKLLIIFFSVGFSIYIGNSFSKRYKNRRAFFQSLYSFLNYLKADINFKSNKIALIIDKYIANCNNIYFKNFLENYVKLIKLKQDWLVSDLFVNIDFITNVDKQFIYDFFYGIGKKSIKDQIDEINLFISEISNRYEVALNDCKKYCPLYLKLGVIGGLFVSLILI